MEVERKCSTLPGTPTLKHIQYRIGKEEKTKPGWYTVSYVIGQDLRSSKSRAIRINWQVVQVQKLAHLCLKKIRFEYTLPVPVA